MNPAKTFKRFVVGGVQALAVASLLAGCADSLDEPRSADAGPTGDDPDVIVDPPLDGEAPDDAFADAGLGDSGPGTAPGDDAGVPGDADAGADDGEDC